MVGSRKFADIGIFWWLTCIFQDLLLDGYHQLCRAAVPISRRAEYPNFWIEPTFAKFVRLQLNQGKGNHDFLSCDRMMMQAWYNLCRDDSYHQRSFEMDIQLFQWLPQFRLVKKVDELVKNWKYWISSAVLIKNRLFLYSDEISLIGKAQFLGTSRIPNQLCFSICASLELNSPCSRGRNPAFSVWRNYADISCRWS